MYPLSDSELEKYYANIYAVANADGKLAGTESSLLGDIRKDLKIKKPAAESAEKAVESGVFQLSPVGTWANQVENLERMLAVALIDGELSDAETVLLATFARVIGVEQPQMDALVAGVKGKLTPSRPEGAGGVEYHDFNPPDTGVALAFAETTSSRFPDILAAYDSAPIRQKCVKDRKTWYLAAWPNGTIDDLIPLALLLAPIRQKAVLIAGRERSWYKTLGFARCAAEREKAYKPEEYCFGIGEALRNPNPWGCREIGMEWSKWAAWFKFGQWVQVDNRILWHFDKAQLQFNIHEAYRSIAFCPYLVKGLPEAVLAVIPDEVDPFNDPDWTYQTTEPGTPGSLNVTLGDQDICVYGVAPKHGDAYQRILDKAFGQLAPCGKEQGN